jgi:hypothetical protein
MRSTELKRASISVDAVTLKLMDVPGNSNKRNLKPPADQTNAPHGAKITPVKLEKVTKK